MQRAVGLPQVLDGEQRLAVQRGRELDAGVHGLHLQLAGGVQAADDDRAGAAIALGAAFLGAGAVQVLAQVLQTVRVGAALVISRTAPRK